MPALLNMTCSPPNVLDGEVDERLHLVGFGDVGALEDSVGAQCRGRRLAAGLVDVGDHDLGAFGDESLGAVPNPMPEEPPVTTATLPASSLVMVPACQRTCHGTATTAFVHSAGSRRGGGRGRTQWWLAHRSSRTSSGLCSKGLPPGAVYALVALGFVLTYKTSGVFNLAFGAQAYVSAAMFFKPHGRAGAGAPRRRSSCRSFVLAPAARARARAADLPPPAHGVGGAEAGGHHRVCRSPSRPCSTSWPSFKAVAGRTPEGIVPDGANVFYDPFGVYAFSRNELVAMGVARRGHVGARRAVPVHARSACACGPWSRARG